MFVPVSKPLLGKEEIKLVTQALVRKEISGFRGSFIKEFEEKFADFCDAKYAATVNSGTTALHLAVAVLGIGPGDEVLVPTMTMMSSFFAVLYTGAKPISVDCDPTTHNIDPALIEEKITRRTKAIMVVHLYGHPVDMDSVLKIARKHKLFVIEDCAEAHGALYKGGKVGSLGDIGCFSFYANKIITTGEGGMITTNNLALYEKAKLLKNLAFGEKHKLMHQAIGFKYQMTNVQAAIGVAQLNKIKKIIKLKRQMAKFYLNNLASIKDIQLPVEKPYAFNVYWMFNIVLKGKLSGKRAFFMDELKKRGVETREDFVPFDEQEIFIKKSLAHKGGCPVASKIGRDGLYLPSGTDIGKNELKYVVNQVKEVVQLLSGE